MFFGGFYRGRRVFVTGHTGFKGAWLSEWLLALGAEVHGYALDPLPDAGLFDALGLAARLAGDVRADVMDREALAGALAVARPDVVFHLAAQPLVRRSYAVPVETLAVNILGTAHVLEAVRLAGRPCTVVCVTSDKCYRNREWLQAYREEDPMGGHDPYSASKGAAELVIASYRDAFFGPASGVRLASARAGNVIGGGDWAEDRIVPDSFRALRAGQAIPVRNRVSTRPWQHVLEPLSGYLHLAAALASAPSAAPLASGFNFGPAVTSNRTVADLVQELLKHVPGAWRDASDPAAVHENTNLNLATERAYHLLRWRPIWDFETTVARTARWYAREAEGASAGALTRDDLDTYQADARALGLGWAG